MKDSMVLLFPVLLPILSGAGMFCIRKSVKRGVLCGYTGCALLLGALFAVWLLPGPDVSFTLFHLTDRLPVYFRLDDMGRLFLAVVGLVWVLAGFFSFSYLKQYENNKRFFGFYLIGYGVMNALSLSGNLITFYLFYEMLTLLTLPLVMHEGTREAIMAGLKYLFFSLGGAYMVLFGLYFVYRFSNTLTFTPRGVLDVSLVSGNESLLLIAAFSMLLGFSVKAGMFPFHSWLPVAHPVAPAPASAVLSGLIVKAGVLGMIRVVFYIFGADFLRGTWVQTTMLLLSLVTVFMGSMLAYLEEGLKKRLAYSTVSQVSYILFGLFLLDATGLTGALLHTAFHAFIKAGLFLCAGAILTQTGKGRIGELTGIGKRMPVTLWCYTIGSLSLIGIPPTAGFLSKWNLCIGALHTKLPVFAWLGPVVLLVSALLTAGYLLPVTIRGFFPGDTFLEKQREGKEAPRGMLAVLLLLAAFSLLAGLFPGGLIQKFSAIAGQLI